MVELDAEFIGINNGAKKAGFEITGKINRQDFGLTYTFTQTSGWLWPRH
jgi:polyisoprenoid-binding protein YceI